MDAWDHSAATGADLDVREALVALERVLGRPGLSGSLRVRLEEAASALREIESGAGLPSLFGEPHSGEPSRPL